MLVRLAHPKRRNIMAEKPPKPFEDNPIDVVWKTGRRIYVRTPYGSGLAKAMRRNGKWDKDQKAWWVGLAKKDAIIELLAEHADDLKTAQAEQAKREKALSANHLMDIPRSHRESQDIARKYEGFWDPERSQWAFTTHEQRWQASAAIEARRNINFGLKDIRRGYSRSNAIRFVQSLNLDQYPDWAKEITEIVEGAAKNIENGAGQDEEWTIDLGEEASSEGSRIRCRDGRIGVVTKVRGYTYDSDGGGQPWLDGVRCYTATLRPATEDEVRTWEEAWAKRTAHAIQERRREELEEELRARSTRGTGDEGDPSLEGDKVLERREYGASGTMVGHTWWIIGDDVIWWVEKRPVYGDNDDRAYPLEGGKGGWWVPWTDETEELLREIHQYTHTEEE